MTDIHRFVAYSIPAGFALLALWALVAFIRNRSPGGGFWNVLAVVQVALAIQVVVGGVLFALGHRPRSNGPVWLHYVYGGLFPAALLVWAHGYARRNPSIAWIVFGVASVVIFGLTFRALQTGLGID